MGLNSSRKFKQTASSPRAVSTAGSFSALVAALVMLCPPAAEAGELFHLNNSRFRNTSRSVTLGRTTPRLNITNALESTYAQRLTNPFRRQNKSAKGDLKSNYYERERLKLFRSVEDYQLRYSLWEDRVRRKQEIFEAKRLRELEKARRRQMAQTANRGSHMTAAGTTAPAAKPEPMKTSKIITSSGELNRAESKPDTSTLGQAKSAIYKLGLAPKTSILDSLKQALFGR